MMVSQQDRYDIYWEICGKESYYRDASYYDQPCLITPARFAEFERLQQLLYKAFRFFLPRFHQYTHILEYSEKATEILGYYNLREVPVGHYRPDFLVQADGQIKLYGIDAYSYESYWRHGVTEYVMEKRCGCRSSLNGKRVIERIIDGVYIWWGGLEKSLSIMQGKSPEGDISLYRSYLLETGTELHYLYPDTISNQLRMLIDGPLLCTLSNAELEELQSDAIEAIANADCLNPLSTIFLLGDNRFLAVLWDDDFLAEAFSPDDAAFLKSFLIPTYTRKQRADLWEEAYHNKDNYILKPQLPGKSSESIYGLHVEENVWKNTFDSPLIRNMVLQRRICQKTFHGSIDGQSFKDLGTGSMLCFEDELQGLGAFRMSGSEAPEFEDSRSMAPWITDSVEGYERDYLVL